MIRNIFYLVLLSTCLQACSNKDSIIIPTTFKEHFKFFKKNDTIVFKNQNNILEKLLIVSIDSGYSTKSIIMPEEPHKFVRVYYIELYENSGKQNNKIVTPKILFEIVKYKKDPDVVLRLSFKDFDLETLNTLGIQKKDTIINQRLLQNYFEFSCCKFEVDGSSEVVKLFWTSENGIEAYVMKNGSIWVRE